MTTHLKNEKSELVGCFSVDFTSATIGRGDCDENNGREKRDSYRLYVFFFLDEKGTGAGNAEEGILLFSVVFVRVLYCIVLYLSARTTGGRRGFGFSAESDCLTKSPGMLF